MPRLLRVTLGSQPELETDGISSLHRRVLPRGIQPISCQQISYQDVKPLPD
jgi:hypothetical protein